MKAKLIIKIIFEKGYGRPKIIKVASIDEASEMFRKILLGYALFCVKRIEVKKARAASAKYLADVRRGKA